MFLLFGEPTIKTELLKWSNFKNILKTGSL